MDINLMNMIPGAIYWINNRNIYQGCNMALAKLFGLISPEEIINKRTIDLPFFQENPSIAAKFDKANLETMASSKQNISQQTMVLNKQERNYIFIRSPIIDQKKLVTGLVAILIDITDSEFDQNQKWHDYKQTKLALRSLLKSLPGHIYWKDLEGRFLGCNLQQAQSGGFASCDEMVGKTDYEMPWKDQANIYRKHDQQVIKTGMPIHVEEKATLNSGELLTVLSNKVPYYNEKGEIIGILGISVDISAQKKIEIALKDTTIALENILENLPGHVYWKDLEGHFLGCNLAQAKNGGLSSLKEIVGKTDNEMPWREQAALYKKNDQTVIKTGVPILAEEEITLENGEIHTYLANKVPLRDKDKNIIGILGISLDMTAQKKMQDRLQNETVNSKVALENILNNLPGHVYWKNLEGRYLGCNLQQAKSCGFNSAEELIGKTDYDMPWREQADLYRKNDQQVVKTGIPIIAEEDATLDNGEIRTFLANKIPLSNEKKQIIGVLGISLDISEQKKMQAALKKAEGQIEGMTLVSAAMAHELRTPLATITMGMEGIEKYLQSLIDAYQTAREHQLTISLIPKRLLTNLSNAVGNINTEAKNANMVVNMLLANLSFQRGKPPTKKLSILDSIDAALSQYPFSKDKQKLVHLERTQDFIFYGDMLLFSHILFNLLKNSLYFIEKVGKGEIYISLIEGQVANELHFKDTGQGIQSKDLPSIFDQFFTKDTHHGTGIGLAFCKAVMESWGGSITCRSDYGKYAEFILSFSKY